MPVEEMPVEEVPVEEVPVLAFNDVLSSLNDANLSSFGQSVIGAFNNGALNNTDAFSALAGLSTQAAVESEVARLIPNLGNIASQETNQALVNIGGLIDGRIADLSVGKSFANRTTQYASNGLNNLWLELGRAVVSILVIKIIVRVISG